MRAICTVGRSGFCEWWVAGRITAHRGRDHHREKGLLRRGLLYNAVAGSDYAAVLLPHNMARGKGFEATEASERLIGPDGLSSGECLIRASHGKQLLAAPGLELNRSATGSKYRTTCG